MDDDFDSETEKLLSHGDGAKFDKDEHAKLRLKSSLSSSDYDDDDMNDFDDDNSDAVGLLAKENSAVSLYSNEDINIIAPVASSSSAKAGSFGNISKQIKENNSNETIQCRKEIDITSKCELRDAITVNKVQNLDRIDENTSESLNKTDKQTKELDFPNDSTEVKKSLFAKIKSPDNESHVLRKTTSNLHELRYSMSVESEHEYSAKPEARQGDTCDAKPTFTNSSKSTSNQVSMQHSKSSDDNRLPSFSATKYLFEHNRDDSTDSDEQMVVDDISKKDDIDEVLPSTGSTKYLFEHSSEDSAEGEEQELLDEQIKLDDKSKNYLESADANNPKLRPISAHDLFEFVSDKSPEKEVNLLPNENAKYSDVTVLVPDYSEPSEIELIPESATDNLELSPGAGVERKNDSFVNESIIGNESNDFAEETEDTSENRQHKVLSENAEDVERKLCDENLKSSLESNGFEAIEKEVLAISSEDSQTNYEQEQITEDETNKIRLESERNQEEKEPEKNMLQNEECFLTSEKELSEAADIATGDSQDQHISKSNSMHEEVEHNYNFKSIEHDEIRTKNIKSFYFSGSESTEGEDQPLFADDMQREDNQEFQPFLKKHSKDEDEENKCNTDKMESIEIRPENTKGFYFAGNRSTESKEEPFFVNEDENENHSFSEQHFELKDEELQSNSASINDAEFKSNYAESIEQTETRPLNEDAQQNIEQTTCTENTKIDSKDNETVDDMANINAYSQQLETPMPHSSSNHKDVATIDFQEIFEISNGRDDEFGELKSQTPTCCENSKIAPSLYSYANDMHEYEIPQHQECGSNPDLESGYFDKPDILYPKDEETNSGHNHWQYDQSISESLRNQLNRFDILIETIDQRNARNIATNAAARGYWSTIFGQASENAAYDDMPPEMKAHRALELLEDYHSRLSEPQDRALRIAIERVIRIFKSRLFQALLARDFMQAYKHQSQCIQSVVKMLQQLKEENWCLPVMYTACLDLRILAQRCEELGNSSKPGEILEKAADCLMSCFRVCAADNRSSDNETKRLGMLHLVNQLFKVYFRINKLHLCKPLIRAIDSSAFKDLFPLPERITYKYFVGRKAMFDSDYKSADEFLTFAFRHCPKNFPRNKRLILIYLVPVKMLLGFLPKKYILERYDVLQFHELAEALKEGNVRKFDDVIQRHEIFFIKCGIYLLVEKLKFIVYRNLFKKVYIIKQTHQLDLNAFRSALQFVGETDMTIDETHCIVANLIFEGKIKGYISHSHNKLVVSKQNPFPPLNTVS